MTTYVKDLFKRAREATTVAIVAGVTLYREGRDWRGECPLCHASRGSTENGAFWANRDQSKWMCFAGCEDRPCDVIELEHRLRGSAGETHRDAALRILREEGLSREDRERRDLALARRDREDEERLAASRAFKAQVAATTWREGVNAAGTLAETYFRACGFHGWPLAEALRMVRFHPRAYHSGNPAAPVTAPAIVGLEMTDFGATGGVHVTYLRPDGSDKSRLNPARRKWGPSYFRSPTGIEHPGGVWLSNPRGRGPVLEGEGLESVLAGAMLFGEPCRMVAALDLSSMQGRLLRDDFGRVDLEGLVLDPQHPAFTWAGVDQVVVCVDNDMSPISLRLASVDYDAPKHELDSTARAQLCTRMVDAAWRTAGASEILFAWPPSGQDVRDQFVAGQLRQLDLRPL